MILLTLLFLKHWYVDFYKQTDAQIKSKGVYGKWTGITHSIEHGLYTAVFFSFYSNWLFVAGAIDCVIHYHVDFLKMRFGDRDPSNKRFWVELGLDQLAHALTYIGLVALFIR